jgi:hypothetical protein
MRPALSNLKRNEWPFVESINLHVYTQFGISTMTSAILFLTLVLLVAYAQGRSMDCLDQSVEFFRLLGQIARSTSGCSAPICSRPSATARNTSCDSNAGTCYSYRVMWSNDTFCAPSVSCSVFETCDTDITCGSNLSICLDTTCCSTPICVPISLGVSMCNSSEFHGQLER